jgi:hypothetical protein
MIDQLDLPQWLLLGAATFLVGTSKTGLPGLGLLIAPLFAAALPPRASTGALLPLLIAGDICAVAFYRRHAVWRHLVRLFPWAAAGVVGGYFVMGRIQDTLFGPVIGGITLLMLAVNLGRTLAKGRDVPMPATTWFAAVMGLLAGFTTMIANAAGAVMVIYLMTVRLQKTEFIGTAAWFFLLLNVFKVPFSASLGLINTASLGLNLRLAPLVIVGSVAGLLLARWIPEKAFGAIVQVLALASAIALFF